MPNKSINTFSGGLNDNPLDANEDQYEVANNLDVTDNEKLKTRWGTALYDGTNYLVDSTYGRIRISNLWVLDDVLFCYAYQNVYYYNSGWTKLTGPTSNPAFPSATTSSRVSVEIWNHHAFLTCDSLDLPIKIYNDATRGWSLRSSGLPYFLNDVSPDQYLRINHLTEIMKYHFQDNKRHQTGVHILLGAASPSSNGNMVVYHWNQVVPATDPQSFIELANILLSAYDAHNTDSEAAAGRVYHAAQQAAPNTADPASTARVSTWDAAVAVVDDLYTKLTTHMSQGTQHSGNTSTLNAYITAKTLQGKSYIWSAHYRYEYTIGDRTFFDLGPVHNYVVPNTRIVDSSNATIFGHLPFIQNFQTGNYDTVHASDRISIDLYRTVDGGKIGYKLANKLMFNESLTESIGDSFLQSATDTLYTSGGRVSNDPPPPCKYFTIANNIGWYANILDESDVERPSRLMQSVQDDIDSVPYDFVCEFDDDITGISSVGPYPIVTLENGNVYRVEGIFDEFGGGGLFKKLISSVAGNKSHNSMVKIQGGMVWFGRDGIYATDGTSVNKISKDFQDTYLNFISSASNVLNITGAYDKENQRVYWCCQDDSTNDDNDTILVLHLQFGFKNGTHESDGVFTMYQATANDSFSPSSILKVDDDIIIGDSRGIVLKMNSSQVKDVRFDGNNLPTAWGTQHIDHNYEGPFLDFGNPDKRKWVSKIKPLLKVTDSSTNIQIRHENDDSGTKTNLKELRFNSTTKPFIEETRNFSTGKLRCYYKQPGFLSANSVVYKSDNYDECTIASGNTARTWSEPFDSAWFWDFNNTKLQLASGALKIFASEATTGFSQLNLDGAVDGSSVFDNYYDMAWSRGQGGSVTQFQPYNIAAYEALGAFTHKGMMAMPTHYNTINPTVNGALLYYTEPNGQLQTSGTIRFMYIHNYNYAPTTGDSYLIFHCKTNAGATYANSNTLYVYLDHQYSQLRFKLLDYTGANTAGELSAYLQTSFSDGTSLNGPHKWQAYDVEFGFSEADDEYYVAINGIYAEANLAYLRTGVNATAIKRLWIGGSGESNYETWDAGIRNLHISKDRVHSAAFHTESLARWANLPRYDIIEEITATSRKTFFTTQVTAISSTQSSYPYLILEIDGVKKYLSGGVITTSNGTLSQSSAISTWNSNLSALTTYLGSGKTIKPILVFRADNFPTNTNISQFTITYLFGSSEGTVKEISIDDYPTHSWPTDIEDYYLTTETDSYTLQHRILERIDGQKIAVLMNTTLANASNKKWQIHGKRKGDILELLNYDIQYEMLPGGHKHYDGVTGGNA